MRILIVSFVYAPSVGGIETVTHLLAREFAKCGHEVTVLTNTLGDVVGTDQPKVIRRPKLAQLVSALKYADSIIMANLTVKYSWPLYLRIARRPWFVVNHTPIQRPTGSRTFTDWFKIGLLRFSTHYSVSEYLARALDAPGKVLSNPYDDSVFRRVTTNEHQRSRELLFVGRLVSAKGVDILILALEILASEHGLRPHLSIIGSGPDEDALRAQIISLGLQSQVRFVGSLPPTDVAREMRDHEVVIVPSRKAPAEAFGLVAVEALACGCKVVAADQGGLPEAVGQHGILVQPECAEDLAAAICKSLGTLDDCPPNVVNSKLDDHLRKYSTETAVQKYLSVILQSASDPK